MDRTDKIGVSDVVVFATVRNEIERLPYFLAHHRALGIGHFLIVDNQSDDGTLQWLQGQPDVSLWRATGSYKAARFGMDWLNFLLNKFGRGRWCLTLDADELFVYPYHDTRPIGELTHWLDRTGANSMSALMIEMYPQGPLSDTPSASGENPIEALPYFDSGNYTITRKDDLWNLWIQGGPRARRFFHSDPTRAPTLSKVPLVRWRRGFTYLSSTHTALPRGLNLTYGDAQTPGERVCGALLHTKFLPQIVGKSAEEKKRGEHFHNSALYDQYYADVIAGPDLWCPHSERYEGWQQLDRLGLISRGGWP